VLKLLPPQLDSEKAHPLTFAAGEGTGGGVNSLGVFLQQEITRFNILTAKMRSSLAMLKKAVKGIVVMSGALEAMSGAMLFQRVPPEWESAAYPSLKPLASWVSDLVARLATLNAWLVGGPPKAYWISGFFFPQGFMTGALQMYARKTRIPIDTLDFKMHVQEHDTFEQVVDPPADGVFIYGMFLVCARFDKSTKKLAEMEPGRLLYRLPVCWLEPVLTKNYDVMKAPNGDYPCPFYKTSKRAGILSTTGHSTNFVMTVGLASAEKPDHWIRRGTAILSEDESGIAV
jgi:dynein heavy chain